MKKVNLGLLTAKQFARDSKVRMLLTPASHVDWILEQGLIEPITQVNGIDYFIDYQIYILDLIEDYRQGSLQYSSPLQKVTWQEHLIVNKGSILTLSKKWNPVAKLIWEAQVLYNTTLEKAFEDKEKYERKWNEKEKLEEVFQASVKRKGSILIRSILKRNKGLTESVIRFWKEHGLPTRVIKHNPMILLNRQLPILVDLLFREEKKFSTVFRKDSPVRLVKFYLQMIKYLDFVLACMDGGRMGNIGEVFITRMSPKVCSVCGDSFMPNQKRKGGKLQKLCGKKECDRDSRKINAKSYRRKLKTGIQKKYHKI